MICTCIMFTCTAQHSAVNFAQYEEYGFPPNYPALLQGEPPVDKVGALLQKQTSLSVQRSVKFSKLNVSGVEGRFWCWHGKRAEFSVATLHL